jgi:hypothetical protein
MCGITTRRDLNYTDPHFLFKAPCARGAWGRVAEIAASRFMHGPAVHSDFVIPAEAGIHEPSTLVPE